MSKHICNLTMNLNSQWNFLPYQSSEPKQYYATVKLKGGHNRKRDYTRKRKRHGTKICTINKKGTGAENTTQDKFSIVNKTEKSS